jgi:uncharacterized protein YbaA (DUF1428 family)
MAYVDGYVLPVPKKNLAAYMKMAKAASKVFKKHGALEIKECAGDDLVVSWGCVPFPKQMKLKAGETVVFSYVVFKNKAHRDKVNKGIAADPAMKQIMPKTSPFDWKRMVYGGFKMVVDA